MEIFAVANPMYMRQIPSVMSAAEIIAQIKALPKGELEHVIEYVHELDRHISASSPELTDAELLSAAKRAGSFAILEAPGEDIYSAKKR